MSEIDMFNYEIISWISCPSSYPIVSGRPTLKQVPVYLLKEDAVDFDAKTGDLLIGGGGGESPALRIGLPEAWIYYQGGGQVDWESAHKCFWSATQAYILCEGYSRLGWAPDESLRGQIESWLTRHVLAFIVRNHPELCPNIQTEVDLGVDGSICFTF